MNHNDLNNQHPIASFCFTIDSFNVHHHQGILEVIYDADCIITCHFQGNWSCDGAIEYVFYPIHSYFLFYQ